MYKYHSLVAGATQGYAINTEGCIFYRYIVLEKIGITRISLRLQGICKPLCTINNF